LRVENNIVTQSIECWLGLCIRIASAVFVITNCLAQNIVLALFKINQQKVVVVVFEIPFEVKLLIFVKTVKETKFALIRAKIVENLHITHVALMYF
jgi:hypothetical protein